MFWKFDLNTTSHVDKLLEKEDVSLLELMDEDDLLQECKAQNQRLLDFLCQPQCMEELVQLITQQPPEDMDEKVRFKYPNIACELLTCDVPQINDKLGEDENLLNILYDFLRQEPPLNPLLASFFSKTIGNLIARKTEQVIGFLRKKEKFLTLVLEHIGTSAMMDLLLRLISCVEPASLRQDVLNWLNEEKLIQRLIDLIHCSQDEDRQSNASQTLCDLIRLSRDQCSQMQEILETDPLLVTLESQPCVEQLLHNMFNGEPSETCVVCGTQILLTLLETRRPSVDPLLDSLPQGYERPSAVVSSSVLQGIESRLKDFHHLLQHPPKKESILTTIGILEEPLGNARLHTARLIAALLQANMSSINQELCRLRTMDLLLDLFFRYTWNNFLHIQVEMCIAAILSQSLKNGKSYGTMEEKTNLEAPNGNAEDSETLIPEQETLMITHLFQECCLVQRILDAWETNDKIQAEGGMRRGNMGHLTRIANAVQNMEKSPIQIQISDFITELPEDCRGRWETFVEETLPETNRRNTVDLVNTHHLRSSSEDEDIDSAFPSELSAQQAFSDYQVQQMTSNFVDQFGFNDEEFAEQEDNINTPFDRITEINFNIEAEDENPNAALFEACYNEHIQQFDDEEEDIWEEKEIGYGTQVKSRTRCRFGASQSSEDSSRSDLENGEPESSPATDDEGQGGCHNAERPPNLSPINGSPPIHRDGATSEGWTAVFDEHVNSKPPTPCVALDVGSSVWDAPAPETSTPEEKGWAKFTDFQPFCCSESGPRCSSPVDTESSASEGHSKQSQDKFFGATSPCVWNVCVARKAPVIGSDSSSSGGSDSEEEDKNNIITETISTGAGHETIRLTMDTKNEKATFSRIFTPAGNPEALVIDQLTIADTKCANEKHPCNSSAGDESQEQKVISTCTNPQGPCKEKSQEDLAPNPEATLNGPA
ncbi:serine/threonine-protein phosphatase 6 regulatory subunit 2 isoform X3 [Bufo gargarizans]|uniref:serine/threonine-protein phosphatase 6 regulatory subunit 2 isoform X3 n=1 Tax=Bufo gargarizans TaxID=30331 RepID=UPI001CF5451A|nr:serine/threonine-protein phosphatase 6 regulatory subunit 2 isoform X3 [Bufo gargarizans]